eukprot:161101_1
MNSLWLCVSCLLYIAAAGSGCKHKGTTYAVGGSVPLSMSCQENSKIVVEKECLSDGWGPEREVATECDGLFCVDLSPGVACVAYGRRDDSAILDRGILDNVDSSN